MNKGIFLLALFLVGCASTSVVCNTPYISVGDSCCLDNDANNICDSDERDVAECEEIFDCSTCPPNIITETETIEVTKYVCQDGLSVVKDLRDCTEAMREFEVEYDPILTNEDDQSVIELFEVRPACRGGFQAIEVHFKVGTAANDVSIEVKSDPDNQYEELFHFSSPVFDKYLYGVFCEEACTGNADFFISPGEKYLLRTVFDMTDTSWEKKFKTNEHVIDATDDGEYTTKLC